jgi:5-methylthioribose kinase
VYDAGMIELTPDNVLDYLRAGGQLGQESIRVTPLGWGVSNAVFRVEMPERLIVLKQSRPQLRTRDLWLSNLDRVYREQEVMQVLHPLLPHHVVPEILFVDRPNYLFAMSHAPLDARVWKESLLSGEVDQGIGMLAGHVLGRIHEATATNQSLIEPFRDHTVFVQLRVDPFYTRIQQRRPEVSAAVTPLIEQMLCVKEALCHGDYSPKNILTHAHGFTLVDYETAHFGDPTMDLGFFLSHLLLKAIKLADDRQRLFDLTRAFWHGYGSEVRFRPFAELRTRGVAHCAVCLLARIDGTSPVDYLPEEPKREAVRRLGRSILLDSVTTWDDVLSLAEVEFRSLSK